MFLRLLVDFGRNVFRIYIPNTKKIPIATIANQIGTLQSKIFLPSKMKKGIKLNKPKKELTMKPTMNIQAIEGKRKAAPRKSRAKM